MATTIDRTRGAARERVAARDVAALRAAGVLVADARRERPRYFDGRFLTARDLIRDQQYVLAREADLGRAAGSGVAAGLHVREGGGPQTLTVEAGHGVTPAGELVLLPRRLDIALANIAAVDQLSARFGLGRIPTPPLRSRNGVFVLALRPVEYTANPIGAYPTAITGARSVEDGDVVEATAAVLIPWPEGGPDGDERDGDESLDVRRGRIARAVYLGASSGGSPPVSANVLPIAAVALQNNTVVWIDEALVRRELGADRGDLPGLGFSPRALRLAHLLQYQDHLADIVARGRGTAFAASAIFAALPPVGPLPPASIDARDFTQRYFPAEIEVDFSPIPEDELAALVEDALPLQPIDFSAPAASLDSTAVMIVAPVPRHEWRAVVARLTSPVRRLRPAAPNLVAQRKPFEVLQKLRLPRLPEPLDNTSPSDAEWQRLARLPTLWFVRRRQLALRDDTTGAFREVTGIDERVVEGNVRSRLAGLGLSDRFESLLRNASPAAVSAATELLGTRRFAESPVLTAAAVGSLSEALRNAEPGPTPEGGGSSVATLSRSEVLRVASEFSAPGAGVGLERVERAVEGAISAESLQQLANGSEAWRRLEASASTASAIEISRLATSLRRREGEAVLRPRSVPPPDVGAPLAAPESTEPIASAEPPPASLAGVDTPEHGSTVVSPQMAAPAAPDLDDRPLSPAKSARRAKPRRP